MLRNFGFSGLLTLTAIIFAWLTLGFGAALTTLVLIAIEVAFSFDNAIINAKVLAKLSRVWQQLFLTIGMVIAVFGIRFVFPISIVMVTAGLSWSQVLDEALHHPAVYGEHLAHAHAAIASFGGAFLLTLTLYFLLDDERKELWLKQLERLLQRLGGTSWLPPLLTIVLVGCLAALAGDEAGTVVKAGVAGAVSYAAIKLFIDALGRLSGTSSKLYTGWGAFGAFFYLQLLDASFSFDGVLGAFAITDKVLLIALGLGVGAWWVRSLTVYLVRHGTLNSYKYLEHGAHYAILILAVALLSSIFYEIPDAVTGATGLGVIWASYMASRQALRDKKS